MDKRMIAGFVALAVYIVADWSYGDYALHQQAQAYSALQREDASQTKTIQALQSTVKQQSKEIQDLQKQVTNTKKEVQNLHP